MTPAVPIGAVLVRRYYTVPDRAVGNVYEEYTTFDEAALASFLHWRDLATDPTQPPLVDERWIMRHADHVVRFDVMVHRTTLAPTKTTRAVDRDDRRQIARREMAAIRARMDRAATQR